MRKQMSVKKETKRVFGVIAEFDGPNELKKVATVVRDAGYTQFDVYSPFPIHGMDPAMGLPPSRLPWFVLVGGTLGLSTGIGLQTWVATTAYPLVISGKPLFSFQAFVPVTFELMVLFSAFTTVFGMLALNKLPQWYHALFAYQPFSKATSHGFFLCIEATDPQFDEAKIKTLLSKAGGKDVETVHE